LHLEIGRHQAVSLSDASRERILLEANFLNMLAGNVFAVGFVAPMVSYAFGVITPADRLDLAIGAALICFGGAIALHIWASATLRRLDRCTAGFCSICR
jgi:hypothetical protein